MHHAQVQKYCNKKGMRGLFVNFARAFGVDPLMRTPTTEGLALVCFLQFRNLFDPSLKIQLQSSACMGQ